MPWSHYGCILPRVEWVGFGGSFMRGLVLAAVGGFLVTKYKPDPPKKADRLKKLLS